MGLRRKAETEKALRRAPTHDGKEKKELERDVVVGDA